MLDQVSRDGGEYIDLMLIHAPWGGAKGRSNNWRALADAKEKGWIRDIGVSNLYVFRTPFLPSLHHRSPPPLALSPGQGLKKRLVLTRRNV